MKTSYIQKKKKKIPTECPICGNKDLKHVKFNTSYIFVECHKCFDNVAIVIDGYHIIKPKRIKLTVIPAETQKLKVLGDDEIEKIQSGLAGSETK